MVQGGVDMVIERTEEVKEVIGGNQIANIGTIRMKEMRKDRKMEGIARLKIRGEVLEGDYVGKEEEARGQEVGVDNMLILHEISHLSRRVVVEEVDTARNKCQDLMKTRLMLGTTPSGKT